MGKRVAVLGGGIAGLSAAHELIERGFEVDVYDAAGDVGGKARSRRFRSPGELPPPGPSELRASAPLSEGRPWLPTEHGFRFFPGFYRHVVDSMARIPLPGGGTVADNLVDTKRLLITQFDLEPVEVPARFPIGPDPWLAILRTLGQLTTPALPLSHEDVAVFAGKILKILSSCDARRMAEFERIGWWDFIEAEARSPAYRKFLADGITRSLVAAKARKASARTIGDIFVQLLFNVSTPTTSSSDRVLDGPTSLVWIQPWREYLEGRGVRFHLGSRVEALILEGDAVSSARVRREGDVPGLVDADWFVLAVPVERAAALMDPPLVKADPALGLLPELSRNVDWMNGIQFFLRRDMPLTAGHAIHIDTPWALTTISQAQFWKEIDLDRWDTHEVRGILSVDVSDWDAPGLGGKAARYCTREEVIAEVWEQLRRSLNVGGRTIVRDEDLYAWSIDTSLRPDPANPGSWLNVEPLLVNLVDTWRLRPEAVTRIGNLFLAADYVRTYTDLATMEAANEAARRAVNGILAASGTRATPCGVWKLHEPEALLPLRAYDESRFAQGLPWDSTLADGLVSAVRAGEALYVGTSAQDALHAAAAIVEPAITASREVIPLSSDGSRSAAPGQAGSPRLFPEVLDKETFDARLRELGERTRSFLMQWMPRGEPDRYLYGPLRSVVASGGKGLRPALLLATAGAFGGNQDRALPAAAIVELLHQSFLVHDDIEDGSELRRGQPALYRREGIPLAINHGDALNALALRLMRESLPTWGAELGSPIVTELDSLLIESLQGQALELGWIRDNAAVGEEDVLRMMLLKTASYSFTRPMRMGALVAHPDRDPAPFDQLGEALGLAFQIQDDVLNLSGSESAYGKEIGGDLYEGKRTVPLVHLMDRLKGRERAWLMDFLGRPRGRKLPREVDQVLGWMRREGSLAYGRTRAAAFVERAISAFETAFAGATEGPDLGLIRGLIGYVVERDR